jgi:hypothetical protein
MATITQINAEHAVTATITQIAQITADHGNDHTDHADYPVTDQAAIT